MRLKAANGLKIPYIGYALLDFRVGGVVIPQKGVVIVKDECLGTERAILGINVFTECWQELTRGSLPGEVVFCAQMSPSAGKKAFAVCRRVASEIPSPPFQGTVKLPKRGSYIVPVEPEVLVWGQVVGGPFLAGG